MRTAYETRDAKWKRLAQWHRWFAWYPICVGGYIVWLETVERKGTPWSSWYEDGLDWEYRLK